MYDWLAHRAGVTPEREALVTADSGNSWDYATLDETVQEMAGRLAGLGVEGGDHLGAVLGTSVEHVCLVHAAMRLGATLAPMSPEFTSPELRERFGRADVDAVVCDSDTEQAVVEACTDADVEVPVFTIDEPQWTDVRALSEVDPATVAPWEWARSDVQLLLFTSGTTGRPKVVQLTMGNLLASAVASAFRLGVVPGDRWLVPLALHHMGGIAPVLRSTLYGTTTVVRGEFDPGGTVDDVRNHDITGVSLVPTMLQQMLSARGTLPDCLRFVLVGGAPSPTELVERCRDFSVPIFPTYGMTETASQVATATTPEAYRASDSVGRPLLWTDVTVVDEHGDPLPAGESGELVVSGPTVTPGYYGDPEATDEAFGEHGLHTGDVGYRDESGRLHVLNRLDDRIITGGENVDPGEVLAALLAHPEVAEASVVGLPDEKWGERVAALIVPQGEEPLVGELESFLRDRLAGYKLPRTVGFANELPRTVSGTVEREAVRDQLVSGTTGFIEHAEAPLVRRGDEADEAADEASAGESGGVTADGESVEDAEDARADETADHTSTTESAESPDEASVTGDDSGDERADRADPGTDDSSESTDDPDQDDAAATGGERSSAEATDASEALPEGTDGIQWTESAETPVSTNDGAPSDGEASRGEGGTERDDQNADGGIDDGGRNAEDGDDGSSDGESDDDERGDGESGDDESGDDESGDDRSGDGEDVDVTDDACTPGMDDDSEYGGDEETAESSPGGASRSGDAVDDEV